jgi:HAD superfamily hydrolase (TIGR01509 family)
MVLRAVIFDVDGTLVDSNDAHTRAWIQALEEGGRRVSYSQIRPLIGMGGDKLLPAAAEVDSESAEGKAIMARRGEIFRAEFLPRLRAFDGARELLQVLKSRGLGLAVASSAERKELEPLLRLAGGDELIDYKASADDAEDSKPDPDIVTAAIRRLKCKAAETMMVGDTPYDIEAARAAGSSCIGFRCGGWDDESLSGAVAIYDGPLDLLGGLAKSPLGGGRGTAGRALALRR